ncbi:MAG: hypothetical protein GX088_07745 [Clostridia bacterium]|nr:hypothetical protein [Clostridia bacterium]
MGKGGRYIPISVPREKFPNINEIWGYGPNTIVVNTNDGRCIKITAAKNIRSGGTSIYYSEYEEMKEIQVGDKTIRVWVVADYPWREGETIEQCLLEALVFVDRSY